MPNQIQATGTLANPPNPLFLFNPDGIRQRDGLLCLNDLHKASGNDPKHKPANFIRKDTTQGLIKALESQTTAEKLNQIKSQHLDDLSLNLERLEMLEAIINDTAKALNLLASHSPKNLVNPISTRIGIGQLLAMDFIDSLQDDIEKLGGGNHG